MPYAQCMFDLWTLRVLVEVGERGSFSAAAAALSMTQPAVSRQIGGLERQLKVPLFQRLPRGVRLTSAGETAVDLARDLLARMRAMQTRLESFADLAAGELRMSAFASANTSFVPAAIRRFSLTYPGVTITLHRADPAGPLAAIRAGRTDLALLTAWELYANPDAARIAEDLAVQPIRAFDGVDVVSLLDEELLVALSRDHPLSGADRIPLSDLADQIWIEGAYPDCLGPLSFLERGLGATPRIGYTCDDWNGKQALIAAGAGIALVPTLAQRTIQPGIVLRHTTPTLPSRRLFAATAAVNTRPAAATAMLELMKTLVVQWSSGHDGQ